MQSFYEGDIRWILAQRPQAEKQDGFAHLAPEVAFNLVARVAAAALARPADGVGDPAQEVENLLVTRSGHELPPSELDLGTGH